MKKTTFLSTKTYFTLILLFISLQLIAQNKFCLLYTSDAADD